MRQLKEIADKGMTQRFYPRRSQEAPPSYLCAPSLEDDGEGPVADHLDGVPDKVEGDVLVQAVVDHVALVKISQIVAQSQPGIVGEAFPPPSCAVLFVPDHARCVTHSSSSATYNNGRKVCMGS